MAILHPDAGERVAGLQFTGPGNLPRPSLAWEQDPDTGITHRGVQGEFSFISNAVEVARVTADGLLLPLFTATEVLFAGTGGVIDSDPGMTYAAATDILTLVGGIVVPAIGPTAAQQHTLPSVTSDTVALLAAAQTLTGKTLNLTSNTLVATSAQLITAVTDETGSSLLVFNTSPTLVTPLLGTPTSGVLTNCTGLPAASLVAGTLGTGNFTLSGTAVLTATTLAGTLSTASQPNITSLGTLTGLTVNATSITLSQDTDFVLSGGVNGVSFDGTTFSIDGTNNRVGIGTTAPSSGVTLDVFPATLDNGVLIRTENLAQGSRTPIFLSAQNVNGNTGNVSVEAIAVNNQQADMVFRTGATTATTFGTERARITTTGNVGIGTSAFGTSAVGVLAIGNGTEPSSSPADEIQLYSVDLSAGNATLGLRTETAVAIDVIAASTHTLSVRINGTTYKILLST